MIVFGTEDVGPLKYLLALENQFESVGWVSSKKTTPYLSNKQKFSTIEKKSCSLVVTGTSLGNSIDKKLIKIAKSLEIISVSIIEHWSWYKKRFVLNGNVILPNHIIVNDEYAKKQAIKDGLPAKIIFVGGNPHLEKLSQSKLSDVNVGTWKKENNVTGKKIILFITEALKNSFLSDTEDYLGYDEFEVLNDIIDIMPRNSYLLIKTHPEEKNDKYDSYQSDHVKVIHHMKVEEMVQVSDMIIGMASMLLIELAMFRDDIISYRPNARKVFVGEKIGETHYAETKIQLKNYLLDPPSSSSMPFRKKYKGSGKRISKFLHSLI